MKTVAKVLFLGLSLLMVFLDYLLQNFDPSTSRAFDWTSARVVYVKLSFIFIWGCLEPNLRPGWRHELVSWLFFNTRIDSYRDVKKISFRGGKLTSISTLVCLATTFKHHIQKSEPHWSVRGRKDADTFLYLWPFPDTKRLCVAPIQKH